MKLNKHLRILLFNKRKPPDVFTLSFPNFVKPNGNIHLLLNSGLLKIINVFVKNWWYSEDTDLEDIIEATLDFNKLKGLRMLLFIIEFKIDRNDTDLVYLIKEVSSLLESYFRDEISFKSDKTQRVLLLLRTHWKNILYIYRYNNIPEALIEFVNFVFTNNKMYYFSLINYLFNDNFLSESEFKEILHKQIFLNYKEPTDKEIFAYINIHKRFIMC